MSLTDFEIGKTLGKGAFGIVCLVKRKFDGKTYAMKRIKIVQLSDKEKENSLNEIRILASLSHKNIIGYKDAFFDKKSKTLNIVMEFANDGDISTKIKYNLKHSLCFRENIIWDYLIQILEGLNYLHEKKIIHRDLKSANIFLMKDNTVKIGDLNVSKINKLGMAYTQTGTPYYASPEIWLDQPYDYKSDIWSLGCILYELCQLKPPFRGTSLKNLCMNIQKGIYEQIPDFYSEELKIMIRKMLQRDPKQRPSTRELLECEIITKKMKELKINMKNNGGEEKQGLIATIRVPRNMGEINKALPKNKYNNKQVRREMLMEDEYETNKRKNGFLDEKDKNEVQNIYKKEKNNNMKNSNGNNLNYNNMNMNYNNIYLDYGNVKNNNMNNNNMNNVINNNMNYVNKDNIYNNNDYIRNNNNINNYQVNNNYMNYNHNNIRNDINENENDNNNFSFGDKANNKNNNYNKINEYGDNNINNNIIFNNKDTYNQKYSNNYYLNQQYINNINNINSNQSPIINNNYIDNSQNNFNININNNNNKNYNNFSFGQNAIDNGSQNLQIASKMKKNSSLKNNKLNKNNNIKSLNNNNNNNHS